MFLFRLKLKSIMKLLLAVLFDFDLLTVSYCQCGPCFPAHLQDMFCSAGHGKVYCLNVFKIILYFKIKKWDDEVLQHYQCLSSMLSVKRHLQCIIGINDLNGHLTNTCNMCNTKSDIYISNSLTTTNICITST